MVLDISVARPGVVNKRRRMLAVTNTRDEAWGCDVDRKNWPQVRGIQVRATHVLRVFRAESRC
ncbi:protein of unknown function [Agreia sp. COWG]|nr:protein of unknown function [Agreia sp. COWG]